MKVENSYLIFNIIAGIGLITAGYFIDSLIIVLGVLVLASCAMVSIVVKIQNKNVKDEVPGEIVGNIPVLRRIS